MDIVDRNAAFTEIACQSFGKTGYSAFRQRVDRPALERHSIAIHRVNCNDPSTIWHVPQGLLYGRKDAPYIDRKRLLEVIYREIGDGPQSQHTCVVHQDVDLAKLLRCRIHCVAYSALVDCVSLDRGGARPVSF